jgi:putative restriction endonuclease
MEIASFIKKLPKLKVDRSKGAPAPHKAILLLSVIQSIAYNDISENKIFITAELVAKFKDNWHALVTNEKFNPNFSLPFYHLKSDGFWYLKTLPGKEILLTSSNSIKSFAGLRNAVAYAYFDDEVYSLLTNPHNREIAGQILLATYFNGRPVKGKEYNMMHDVERQILHESPSRYSSAVMAVDDEEIFVRSGVFKKVVPKIYNYTCCVSGMKITATRDVQMIDACHIVPFAESHDDTISNGISLSPNFHRAFDRFLITINPRFEVVVSEHFTESGSHSIRPFHGRQILLPHEEKYHPSADNLRWHFERFKRFHG